MNISVKNQFKVEEDYLSRILEHYSIKMRLSLGLSPGNNSQSVKVDSRIS